MSGAVRDAITRSPPVLTALINPIFSPIATS